LRHAGGVGERFGERRGVGEQQLGWLCGCAVRGRSLSFQQYFWLVDGASCDV